MEVFTEMRCPACKRLPSCFLSQKTKDSPEYTEESLLTRDYEMGLHRHYNRKGYWIDELAAV